MEITGSATRVNGALLPRPEQLDEELRHGRLAYLFTRRYLEKWSRLRETFPEKGRLADFPAVHVEIGCGRAKNLINLSPQQPHTLYIGTERDNHRFQAASRRAERLARPNLLILRRDVVPLVAFNFPDSTVDEYDLFYPDPWPRYRHRRRRWYRHPFVLELLRTLKQGGSIRLTSDRLFYVQEAAWMFGVYLNCRLELLEHVQVHSNRTHFESKYLQQGRRLYELVVRKTGDPPADVVELQPARNRVCTAGENPWGRG
ncbi:MAG: hypothetical protein JXQ27_17425 [Acidobacteria bacterium]|nr:hypothetical protein [Acidobacteriota bacterium]